MPNEFEEIKNKFIHADKTGIPDFRLFTRPMDRALWVLWVAKAKIGCKSLTVRQIVQILIDAEEISESPNTIWNALSRAGDKVLRNTEKGQVIYEIMKPGKDHLLAQNNPEFIQAFYFEPNSKYSSPKILKNQILQNLDGELRIVDSYIGEKTLDIFESVKEKPIRFMTSLNNIKEPEKTKLLRLVKDFKTENPLFELRNYTASDIHDRYVISDDAITLLGHSFKDLGAKESFSIILERAAFQDIYSSLDANFNRRWKNSSVI